MSLINLSKGLGQGLADDRRPVAGEAKESINILHGRRKGVPQWQTRPYVKRYVHTSPTVDLAIEGLFELRKANDTLIKFAKLGQVLYTFDSGGTMTLLLTGLTTGERPFFTSGFGRAFICSSDGNNVSDGSTTWPLVRAAPSGTMTPTESATAATGFGTGIFEYTFSDYDPTNGWESVPKASVSLVKSNANKGVDLSDPGTYTAQYSKKRIYRRLRGTNEWHLIGGFATGEFPVTDTTIEDDLTAGTLSEVHDNTTALIDMEVPSASEMCFFHKGRLYLKDGSKIRWSKVGLPFIFKSSGVAEYDFLDDEDEVQNAVSYQESIIIFKKRAIWVMNGDLDEDAFTFYPITKQLGLFGPHALVCTPQGVLFLASDRQFYNLTLDPGSISKPLLTSTAIDLSGLSVNDADLHSAGWEPFDALAYFTIALSATTFQHFVIALDGFNFGTLEHAMGEVVPRAYGHLSAGDAVATEGDRKLFFGDEQGWVYETRSGINADGPPSGTITGTATGTHSSTTLQDTGATFYTTGDDLKGLSITKIAAADGAVETRRIASNTSDTITVTAAWTTDPVNGDTYHIGAMHVLWWSGELDAGLPGDKHFTQIRYSFQRGVGSFDFGVTEEGGTDRTEDVISAVDVSAENSLAHIIHSRAYSICPFIEAKATSLDLELNSILLWANLMRALL